MCYTEALAKRQKNGWLAATTKSSKSVGFVCWLAASRACGSALFGFILSSLLYSVAGLYSTVECIKNAAAEGGAFILQWMELCYVVLQFINNICFVFFC